MIGDSFYVQNRLLDYILMRLGPQGHEFCHQQLLLVLDQWHLISKELSPSVKPIVEAVLYHRLHMANGVVLHEHV